MLRVRLIPLNQQLISSDRAFVESDLPPVDQGKRTADDVASGRWINLLMFSRIACGLNCAMLIFSFTVTLIYETGRVNDEYRLKNPLTHTAMVWTPYSDEGTPSNPLLEQATCKSYVSRDFHKPDAFVQEATFLYSTIHSRWLITSAVGFGFLFQLVTVMDKTKYYEPFTVGNTHVTGYLERSISMPLFVVVLLLQVGMHDVWTILSLMFNAWGSMLFCFFAEILFQGDGGFLPIGDTVKRLLPNVAADSVRNGGGIALWRDGNVHYHALAMLIAIANYVLVSGGLIYNTILINSCIASQPKLPTVVALSIYAIVVLYGLLLLAQTFVAYIKDKPCTVEADKAALIASWGAQYNAASPTDDQMKALNKGLNNRTDYALHLEFVYGLLDLLIKSVMTMSFFLFSRN